MGVFVCTSVLCVSFCCVFVYVHCVHVCPCVYLGFDFCVYVFECAWLREVCVVVCRYVGVCFLLKIVFAGENFVFFCLCVC